jgi:colanic acid/amylovoran biosynthesis glycosyltransferase
MERAGERAKPNGRSLRLAYLTGRYPYVSHTFILREVRALRRLGVEIDTFSIWRSNRRGLLARADREEHARTFAVLPLSWVNAVSAHTRALAAAPKAYMSTAMAALRLARPGLRGRLMGMSWFVECMIVWAQLKRRGIRHIHVHINGTAPFVGLLVSRFGTREDASAPLTWSLTVHGPSEFYDVYGERLAAKVCDASLVVCVSDFARSQLMSLVSESQWEKLHVVHCGVDLAEFPLVDRPPHDDVVDVLCVGRLVQVKAHAVLISAMAILLERGVPVRLTIVGDGPKRADLQQIVQRLDIRDRVRFAGAVGQDDIRSYYRDADVFALPSVAEGLPVVLMEAMATGLPVIASAIMGVGELVEDGATGVLVRPGRPDLLANALEELARAPDRRQALGRAGRARVAAEFELMTSARLLAGLFSQTLSADHAPTATASSAAAT